MHGANKVLVHMNEKRGIFNKCFFFTNKKNYHFILQGDCRSVKGERESAGRGDDMMNSVEQ